jgi:outer membrane protein assembly factor BamB
MSTRASLRAKLARVTSAVSGVCLLLAAQGCGAGSAGVDYGRYDATSRVTSGPALRVRWSKLVGPEFGGPYIPVERAGVALDQRHDRLFIGSSDRIMWAFEAHTGRALWKRDFGEGIDAEPTLDPVRDELYVATAGGQVYALGASDGEIRFKVDLGASVSKPGVLSDDALYLVTDGDGVLALSRKDGSTLWRYQRDSRAGLKVTGHAGLLVSDQRVITGFNDGIVVALAKGDGHALWIVDTTLDLEDTAQAELGFVDVDTTPVQVGETVYVASFLAGLYGLSVQDGSPVFRRAELTGVTGLAGDERTLTLISAERGVTCYDLPSMQPRWVHKTRIRGAANSIRLNDRTLFVTESQGALVALAIADGTELGRLQTEHGFSTNASIGQGSGAILGNSGVVYAFDY